MSPRPRPPYSLGQVSPSQPPRESCFAQAIIASAEGCCAEQPGVGGAAGSGGGFCASQARSSARNASSAAEKEKSIAAGVLAYVQSAVQCGSRPRIAKRNGDLAAANPH